MRLWIDTAALGTAGQAVQAKVGEMKARVNQQVLSRGTRAVNQLRNAELEVLRGKGSGRTYRKYPYKSTYQASAPGEPPARRTGNLRLHWTGNVKGGGGNITLELESAEFYARLSGKRYKKDGTKTIQGPDHTESIATDQSNL